jgi:hypothetical protein
VSDRGRDGGRDKGGYEGRDVEMDRGRDGGRDRGQKQGEICIGRIEGGIAGGINGGIKGGENLEIGQREGLKSRTTVPLKAILKQL